MEESIATLLKYMNLTSLLNVLKVLKIRKKSELMLDKPTAVQVLTQTYLSLKSEDRYNLLSLISYELGYQEELYYEDTPYATSL